MNSNRRLSWWISKLAGAAMFALIMTQTGATTVVPPEFAALVNDSDYIVRGVTKSITAEKRAGMRGVKIVTLVELEVTEVVAGTPPAKVVLELLGGQVGDEGMAVEGMPHFKVGDEDILFVSGNGRTICPLYGMMYGRYAVLADSATGRKFVARSDGTPLQAPAGVSGPMAEPAGANAARRATAIARAMGPEEFIRQIKAARSSNVHSPSAK